MLKNNIPTFMYYQREERRLSGGYDGIQISRVLLLRFDWWASKTGHGTFMLQSDLFRAADRCT